MIDNNLRTLNERLINRNPFITGVNYLGLLNDNDIEFVALENDPYYA